MAFNSSSDIQFSIIPEVTLGVTPNGGTDDRYELPIKTGASVPVLKGNEIKSDTMRPNRASAGSRRGNKSGDGSFDFRFQSCDAIDLLISSALSNAWADVSGVDTILAGKTDKSFSVVSALSSTMYSTSAGCVASSMKLDGSAGKEVNCSFDFVFISQTNGGTNNTNTITSVGATTEFVGGEVTIDVAGQTLKHTEFSLEISQDRAMRDILGSFTPAGVASTGLRGVKLTVKAFRESFAIDSAITGAPQVVTITIGTVGDGYKITIPAANGMVPYNETAESMMVVLEFSGGYDDTATTDLKIEKL